MCSTSFVAPTTVPNRARVAATSTCTFFARTAVRAPVRSRQAAITMGEQTDREDGYVIKESEFKDDCEESTGDGFVGEADMDDMLGVGMPEDLASFEVREIQNTKNRDELVAKLKDIAVRRRDIRYDRRAGLGMDNVGNYLDNL